MNPLLETGGLEGPEKQHNYAKALRKYPAAYSDEYDELQKKGRWGRSAAEQVRYRELQRQAYKARVAMRRAARIDEEVRARLELERPEEPPVVTAEEPPPRPPIPDPDPGQVAPDQLRPSSSSSPSPAPPPPESPPGPEAPGSVGASSPAADGPRPPIPPPAAPPRPSLDDSQRELRRMKFRQALLSADAKWAKWVQGKLGEVPPELLRHGVLYCVDEYAHRKGLLYHELSDNELLAGAIIGGTVVYGIPTGLAFTVEEPPPEGAKSAGEATAGDAMMEGEWTEEASPGVEPGSGSAATPSGDPPPSSP